MPEHYEIKIKGHLDQRWSEWFAGLRLTPLDGDETLLSGSLADQAALHGLLERIRDLNLTLISVTSNNSWTQNPSKEKEMKTQTNMQKMILVIGGTGRLGQPVAHALQQAGFQARVMTRDLQTARKMFDAAMDIFDGDPMDPNCLDEALHGSYGVHISLPSEIEQPVTEKVTDLAHKHGVKRISYISGATVAEENCWSPMVNRKFLAEKAIRESGIPYTIFCPTWVMEILPMFINQGRASILGKQPYPYHWVAAEDIARMVATSYALEEAANQRFIIHGPEAIQMQDALRRYCSAFHPEIKNVTNMPLGLVSLLAAVTGNHALKDAGKMFSYFEKVGEWKNLPQTNCILGAPSTTLDKWLETRKTKFAALRR